MLQLLQSSTVSSIEQQKGSSNKNGIIALKFFNSCPNIFKIKLNFSHTLGLERSISSGPFLYPQVHLGRSSLCVSPLIRQHTKLPCPRAFKCVLLSTRNASSTTLWINPVFSKSEGLAFWTPIPDVESLLPVFF